MHLVRFSVGFLLAPDSHYIHDENKFAKGNFRDKIGARSEFEFFRSKKYRNIYKMAGSECCCCNWQLLNSFHLH